MNFNNVCKVPMKTSTQNFGTIDIKDVMESLTETANPILHQYYNNLSNRCIIINKEIEDNIMEYAVFPIIQFNKEDEGKPTEERQKITIYINTLGGEIHNGFALCDIIELSKTPIDIIVMGYAYSMGSFIVMSGALNPIVKRYCYPFSTLLIHGGSQFINGSASQVEDYFKFNKRYEERIKKYLVSHSKITPKQYKDMERNEWFMDSDDMIKYGLVDEVLNTIK